MKHLSKDIATFFTFAIICSSFLKCQAFSSAPWMTGGAGSAAYPATPEQREEVVRRYFDGVNRKDSEQIKSCFADKASITDICSINASKRVVESDLLAERCMEFLAAHPDCKVDFHYPPTCGRNNNWVFAHWYETGTWTGDTHGIKASGNPMAVEGQTRFYVNDDLKITEFVVTRTFTEWENTLQNMARNQQLAPPQRQQPPPQQRRPVRNQFPNQFPNRVQSMQQTRTVPAPRQNQTFKVERRQVNAAANKKRGLDWTQPGKQGTNNNFHVGNDGDKLGFTSRGEKPKKEKGAGLTWSD